MTSTFTWLDYSEHERRKMLDVIELFNSRTTRDELGIGGIRDAFADLLFPGTTTIQTVAKYFLLVPWMYLQLAQRNTICVATWGGYSDISERSKTLRCADSMSVAYQA